MKKITFLACLACALISFVSCDRNNNDLQSGSIYGEVTDKTTGSPIANAGVELQPSDYKATTGSDGHFEFSNLLKGNYTLIVSKAGYSPYESQIFINDGDKKRNDVQLEKALTSIVVVDDYQNEVNTIDFGSNEGTDMRSFILANKSDKAIGWEIKHENVAWIQSITPSNGYLNINATQSVVITIDRSLLPNSENSALIHISSEEGSKDITIKAGRLDVIETIEYSNVTATTAIFSGKLNDNLNGAVYSYGFVYAIDPAFLDVESSSSYMNKAYFSGNKTGSFTYKATNLEKNKTYYMCAFAQTLDKVYYGHTLQFTTSDGVINYYIKHPWNGGEWIWRKMVQDGDYYTYTGRWGGEGVNINTSASDADAVWIPANEIWNADHFYLGEMIKFIYDPSSESISLENVVDNF